MRSEGPWRTVQPRESIRIWTRRLAFNFFPAFRATGARVIYISEDMRKLRIKLPLNLRTRNIHGTLFGGAMYAATDPLYVILVKSALGAGYTVWDKAGTIRYKKIASLRSNCSTRSNWSTRAVWCMQSCKRRSTRPGRKCTNYAKKPRPPGSARIPPVDIMITG